VPHISLVFGEMWEINLLSRVDPPGLFIRTGAQWRDLRFISPVLTVRPPPCLL